MTWRFVRTAGLAILRAHGQREDGSAQKAPLRRDRRSATSGTWSQTAYARTQRRWTSRPKPCVHSRRQMPTTCCGPRSSRPKDANRCEEDTACCHVSRWPPRIPRGRQLSGSVRPQDTTKHSGPSSLPVPQSARRLHLNRQSIMGLARYLQVRVPPHVTGRPGLRRVLDT